MTGKGAGISWKIKQILWGFEVHLYLFTCKCSARCENNMDNYIKRKPSPIKTWNLPLLFLRLSHAQHYSRYCMRTHTHTEQEPVGRGPFSKHHSSYSSSLDMNNAWEHVNTLSGACINDHRESEGLSAPIINKTCRLRRLTPLSFFQVHTHK